MKVPYTNLPLQGSSEWPALSQVIGAVINKGNFILGEEVEAFEKEFANFCGVKHAVGVGNGTDSLIMCLKLLGVGEGDEVITTANSWVSSTSAICLVGASPAFVDVGPDQLIDVSKIEAAITPRTKVIMPIHLTGRMADMDAIFSLAEKHELDVLEDAAQAVGAKRGRFQPGTQGNLCSYSLHPLKNLNALGDGGIITTENDDHAAALRLMRNHGLVTRDKVSFWGYNSRLDELQAAVLRYRLKYLSATFAMRQHCAKIYDEGLKFLTPVTVPVKREEFHTYHLYVIQCEERDQLKDYLARYGIETKIHYPIPIHRQNAALYLEADSLPQTEWQADTILSLPINQYLSAEQIYFVIEKIKAFYEA